MNLSFNYYGGESVSGITGNVITNNTGVGVEVQGNQSLVLTLSGNDIYQNASFDVRNDSSCAVVANGNYWGDQTDTQLSQGVQNLTRIYDIRDGAQQQVVIRQWYAAPLSSGNPGSLQNFMYGVSGVTVLASGTIDSANWSGTVLVVGDVTVGGNLTIAPGTQVLFAPLQDTQTSGADHSRCELIVNGGTVTAAGTPGAPIVFTSAGPAKNPGDWYGIRVVAGNLTLNNCVVEDAVEGIRFECQDTRLSTYALTNVTVQGCRGDGVWTTSGQYAQPVLLNNFQIQNNGGYGINGNGALVLNGCTVSGNGRDGVWVQAPLQMNGCTASQNYNWGVEASSPWISVEVWNSTVQSNGSGGLSLTYAVVGVVSNTISRNEGNGLNLSFNYYGGESASGITGSVITNNMGVGVEVQGNQSLVLTLSGNDIYQNASFDLRNDSAISVVTTNGYWGEPTTTEFLEGQANLSRIYDQHDNSSDGQVLIQSIRGSSAQSVPHFTQQPQSLSANTGDTVTLSPMVSGAPTIMYQWFFNNLALPQATGVTLTLSNVTSAASGGYFLVASNANGSATSVVAYLAIVQQTGVTSITQQPQSQAISVGGTVTLGVAVAGVGPFTYQWSKDGRPISGATAATFSIAAAVTNDTGAYTVTIAYPGGSISSQTATLSVYTSGGSSVTRQISRSGTNFFVTVTVVPTFGTPAYLVEEFIPTNFSVSDISTMGSLDAPNGRVVWGPFWDGLTRSLTYTLVPPPDFTGTATLNGAAMFFGATATTGGDNTVSIVVPTSRTTLGISPFYGFFMITINGTVGSSYRLEAAGDLAGPWEPLVVVTLTSSPWAYVDWESTGQTKRFYRTVLVEQ